MFGRDLLLGERNDLTSARSAIFSITRSGVGDCLGQNVGLGNERNPGTRIENPKQVAPQPLELNRLLHKNDHISGRHTLTHETTPALRALGNEAEFPRSRNGLTVLISHRSLPCVANDRGHAVGALLPPVALHLFGTVA